jgi:hypothetical protein
MAAARGTMTIEQLLARMAALAQEGTRLHREYLRLGTERHERLQGADHVLARGHARPTLPATAPTERRHDPGSA